MTKSEAKKLKAILSSRDVRASLGLFLAPAHPPAARTEQEKQLGEKGGEAPSGETFPQWKNRVETLERGRDAAMSRAQRATEERDAAVERAAGMERAAEQWKKSAFRMQELVTLLRAESPHEETDFRSRLFDTESALFEEQGANILNRAALKNAPRERDEARLERDGLSAEVFGANAEMDKAIDRMRKAEAESSRLSSEMARKNPKMGGK